MSEKITEQFLIDSRGRKTAVVLKLHDYHKLMEDLHDLAMVAERREEEPVSEAEMKRRLRRDGLL